MTVKTFKRITPQSKDLAAVQKNVYEWSLGIIKDLGAVRTEDKFLQTYGDQLTGTTVQVLQNNEYSKLGFWLFIAGTTDGTANSASIGIVSNIGMQLISLSAVGLSAITRETASGNIVVTNSTGATKTIITSATRLGEL